MTTKILHLSHYKFNGVAFIPRNGVIRPIIQYVAAIVLFFSTVGYPLELGYAQAANTTEQLPASSKSNVELPETVLATEAASYIKRVNSTLSETDASNFANHVIYSASAFKLDIAVLLALITIESRFNPEAASKFGAQGLMQVIPRWHTERIVKSRKVTNTYSLYEPKLNIYVGAWALRDFIGESKNLDNALLRYNGSLSDPNKTYAKLVMAEVGRVRDVLLNRQAKL